jgi:hypothetical protein
VVERFRLAAALAMVLATGCTSNGAESAEAEAALTSLPPAVETLTPGTSSGPLDAEDLPEPSDLGPGWRPYVDPGGHGYAGNGEFVRARDVTDVARSLVPLGCAGITGARRLPVPEHALEATFRDTDGRAAVALVLEYGDQAMATAMLEHLAYLLTSCPRPIGDVSSPTLVVDVLRPDATTIHDVRRQVGPAAEPEVWSEVVVRRGSRVGLTIVQAERIDFPGLTRRLRQAVG